MARLLPVASISVELVPAGSRSGTVGEFWASGFEGVVSAIAGPVERPLMRI